MKTKCSATVWGWWAMMIARAVKASRCHGAWVALLLGGCASIDTTPAGNPERVLTGAVNFNGALPAGAEVVVRLIEPTRNEAAATPANDLPVRTAATVTRGEQVLGEFRQVLPTMAQQMVPFSIEYVADDTVLRRGLTVDVRVSFGGKVRMRTINAHVVTLAASPFRQEVWVQTVQ